MKILFIKFYLFNSLPIRKRDFVREIDNNIGITQPEEQKTVNSDLKNSNTFAEIVNLALNNKSPDSPIEKNPFQSLDGLFGHPSDTTSSNIFSNTVGGVLGNTQNSSTKPPGSPDFVSDAVGNVFSGFQNISQNQKTSPPAAPVEIVPSSRSQSPLFSAPKAAAPNPFGSGFGGIFAGNIKPSFSLISL